MRTSKLLVGLFICALFSCIRASEAFATDQAAREFILCKNSEEVRILSILDNDSKSGCVAHYSKRGKDEIIAQAKNTELCHDRVKQLQGILKSANFNCKSVAKAQVTISSEVGSEVSRQ